MESSSTRQPLVTVLLPVYNAETTLCRALDSLLQQTYKNIEIIAINDGSKDNSLSILQDYQARDPRLKVFSRENKGLITTLNEGLQYAQGKYIVREDSDDYSHLSRIAMQVSFMEEHQDVIVAGTYSQSFGKSTKKGRGPTSREYCKSTMLFYPCIAHPSTIIRKSFLDTKGLSYPTAYKHCEDYALWTQIIDVGGQIAKVPVILHYYNNHELQVSVQNRTESSQNHYRIVQERLRKLGVAVESDLLVHLVYADKRYMSELTPEIFNAVIGKYLEILEAATENGYSRKAMQTTIHKLVAEAVNNKIGLPGFLIYNSKRKELGTSFDPWLLITSMARSIKNTAKPVKYLFKRNAS